jgi:hypothetical protein
MLNPSAALLYCLRNDWGGETLSVNGRFEVAKNGDRYRFFRWFSVANANSHGVVYDLRYYLKKFRWTAKGSDAMPVNQ